MAMKDEKYRAEKQEEIKAINENLKTVRDEKAALKSKKAYDSAVKMYQKEEKYNPGSTMNRFTDSIGDKFRSIGKYIGMDNNMTSRDDEAQMQARKDVRGYKKGGLVTRADGAAKRGKTKGRTI